MMLSWIHIAMRRLRGLCGCGVLGLCVLLSVLNVGCIERDVVSPDDAVMDLHVAFMWDHAEEASVEGMTVYMYPVSSGGRIWRFDLSGREGGVISLPCGEYRMIAINNDLAGVRMSDTGSFSTLMANAVEEPGIDGVTRSTGMLYGSVVERVRVNGCGVSYLLPDGDVKECPRGLIRCSPDSLSTIYNVTVSDVHTPANTVAVSAILSGLNSALVISTATPSGHVTSAVCALARSKGNDLTGVTSDFAPPRDSTSLRLTLVASTSEGLRYEKSYDVSRQALNSISPRNVYILITDVDFPDHDTGQEGDDVGMKVGIDGWREVEIDYDTSGKYFCPALIP